MLQTGLSLTPNSTGNGLLDEDEHARCVRTQAKEEDENLGARACERGWFLAALHAPVRFFSTFETQARFRTQMDKRFDPIKSLFLLSDKI